jgi:hypothetical protein
MTLSRQECQAGISRQALATLTRKPTNGDTPHHVTAKVVTNPAPLTTKVDIVGDGCKELVVINTPYRKLSVLEMRDGLIVLRDVAFVGTRADVALIHLEREQAHALADVLLELEQKS